MQLFQSLFASQALSTVHIFLIVIHVTTALLSLVLAPLAMAVFKGGKAHRLWGKAYFWGMFITNGTALLLLTWRFNIFLLGVTVLSFYGAFSGYRVIYRKQPQLGVGPTRLDWGAGYAIATTGVALLLWGVLTGFGLTNAFIPSGGGSNLVFVILPIIFGLAILRDGLIDLRMFRNPAALSDRNWWWYYHMERMLGSYIGLSTALMVQQVGPRLPDSLAWIAWIAPTVIGSPLIAVWVNRYRQQFAAKRVILEKPGMNSGLTIASRLSD